MRTAGAIDNTLAALWRAHIRRLLLLLCAVASAVGAAAATPSTEVPQSWIRYAELVSREIEIWLADREEVAMRFRAFLEHQLIDAKDHPPVTSALVKSWIDPKGSIERVEFESFGSEQADKDFRTLLTRKPLSEPPPPDMRQPLVLRIGLRFDSALTAVRLVPLGHAPKADAARAAFRIRRRSARPA